MVMNCFDIESCVNAFLGPSSGLLQKEDEQEEKEVFLAVKAENHVISGPGHRGTMWVGGECRCFSTVASRVWRPLPCHVYRGLSPCSGLTLLLT